MVCNWADSTDAWCDLGHVFCPSSLAEPFKSSEFGDLQVNLSELKVNRDKQEIEITKREGEIIRFLAANANRIISRDELYKEVWGENMSELGTRTVDMHIAKLRGKIELDTADPRIIKTIRGAGYKYELWVVSCEKEITNNDFLSWKSDA